MFDIFKNLSRPPEPDIHRRKFKGTPGMKWYEGMSFKFLQPRAPRKIVKEKYVPANAAIGKRHACEGINDFKARRKICNAKRRQREKNWNRRLQAT